MMGRRPLEATQVLIDALQLPLTAEEFNKELYEKLYDMFPHAELMPGMCCWYLIVTDKQTNILDVCFFIRCN